MSTKIQVVTATIAALGLGLIVVVASGAALGASDQERYNIGHHDGAMKGGYDEQVRTQPLTVMATQTGTMQTGISTRIETCTQ